MILLLLLLGASSLFAAGAEPRGFPSREALQEREWETKARRIPEPERIREAIRRISAKPHHAGSPESKATAEYVLQLLRGWGLDASIEEFEALLPWPTVRKLELLGSGSVAPFEAKLAEPAIPEDPTSADPGQLPTYNAYSPDGNVTAPLVYVNYGVPEDYDYLQRQGIDVKGKIVLARYGLSWRGVKPKVAYEHGAAACLIYSDPRDDGYFPGDVYPLGPFRPPDGVQRGSVMDMAVHPGDPLSPGWASEKGSRRLTLGEAATLQKIPVLPISYADALPLLRSLGGPVAPEGWRGALGVTYHLGPGPGAARLRVAFDWSTRPIYDVIARIPGADFPDQWVMYGNHHDAWVNGAADPASGLASLLETARSLAELSRAGWRPRRTVMFAVWDAEEFGLIGSTEWAEKHAAEIDKKLVCYLNSDMNGKGRLEIQGSHSLETFWGEVLREVDQPGTSRSLFQAALDPPKNAAEGSPKPAGFRIGPLGSGSDYTAFLDHLGVASVTMGFSENEARGIYHSIYDSFYWYSHFDDTDYTHGRALSQVMATALLRLSGAPLLPFEFGALARTIDEYWNGIGRLKGAAALHREPVRKELERLKKSAAAFEARYRRGVEKSGAAEAAKLAEANRILYSSERTLLAPAGLPGRAWFKHQIYAPGLYTGYGAKTLPGVREAAEAGRWDEANRQAEALAGALRALRERIEQAEKALARL